MAASAIIGVSQALSALRNITGQLQTKVAVRMVAVAAQAVKLEARKIAQRKNIRRTGALINNIVIKRENDVPAETVQYNIGVRHGLGGRGSSKKIIRAKKGGGVTVKYEDDPYYWYWVEAGHKIVKRNLRGEKTTLKARRATSKTRVGAKPFLFPAIEAKRAAAPKIMQNILNEELAKLDK